MPTAPTLSYNEILVLQALSQGCGYGLEIIERTGLSPGTVYPILRRLEAQRRLVSRREGEDLARAEGRPVRRLVEVTAAGRKALSQARAELHALHASLGLLPDEG